LAGLPLTNARHFTHPKCSKYSAPVDLQHNCLTRRVAGSTSSQGDTPSIGSSRVDAGRIPTSNGAGPTLALMVEVSEQVRFLAHLSGLRATLRAPAVLAHLRPGHLARVDLAVQPPSTPRTSRVRPPVEPVEDYLSRPEEHKALPAPNQDRLRESRGGSSCKGQWDLTKDTRPPSPSQDPRGEPRPFPETGVSV
jgi:hypothetical protein